MPPRSSRPPEVAAGESARAPDPEASWATVEALFADSMATLLLLDGSGAVLRGRGDLAGHPAGSLVGRRLADLVQASHRPLADAAVKDAVSPALPHRLRVPVEGPRGVRWYDASISPVRSAGQPPGVLVVALDDQARQDEDARLRLHEKLMREVEQVAGVGIWTWDPKDPAAWWSPQLYRIYALDPAAHVPTYQDYLTRVHPDDRARVMAATEAVFKDHRPYSHDERIFRPGGEVRWLHTWAHAVTDAAGDLRQLVGVCQDITDRKRAEEELERSRRQLQVTEKLTALGTLVSGVGHEVRTPLTYIALHLSLVQRLASRLRDTDPALAAELERHAAAGLDGTERIAKLVAQLRQFARPSPALAPAGLHDVARETLDLFAATHRGQVELETDLRATPPYRVDRHQLAQVLLNLLNNAAEAMPKGGRVQVRTAVLEGGEGVLEVRDDGPGIAPEVQQRLFDPFFTTKAEGTGLGLSISRRIVEAHGGTLTYATAPAQGTTFTVRLPAAPPGVPRP